MLIPRLDLPVPWSGSGWDLLPPLLAVLTWITDWECGLEFSSRSFDTALDLQLLSEYEGRWCFDFGKNPWTFQGRLLLYLLWD